MKTTAQRLERLEELVFELASKAKLIPGMCDGCQRILWELDDLDMMHDAENCKTCVAKGIAAEENLDYLMAEIAYSKAYDKVFAETADADAAHKAGYAADRAAYKFKKDGTE